MARRRNRPAVSSTTPSRYPDDAAEFWSLFGHVPGQGLECIGDFAIAGHAEEVIARITGRRYAEHASTRGSCQP
jgi:hypothetical protein